MGLGRLIVRRKRRRVAEEWRKGGDNAEPNDALARHTVLHAETGTNDGRKEKIHGGWQKQQQQQQQQPLCKKENVSEQGRDFAPTANAGWYTHTHTDGKALGIFQANLERRNGVLTWSECGSFKVG